MAYSPTLPFLVSIIFECHSNSQPELVLVGPALGRLAFIALAAAPPLPAYSPLRGLRYATEPGVNHLARLEHETDLLPGIFCERSVAGRVLRLTTSDLLNGDNLLVGSTAPR
jgi:hypothetical protein